MDSRLQCATATFAYEFIPKIKILGIFFKFLAIKHICIYVVKSSLFIFLYIHICGFDLFVRDEKMRAQIKMYILSLCTYRELAYVFIPIYGKRYFTMYFYRKYTVHISFKLYTPYILMRIIWI